jgi:serine/threonine protein kinase
VKLTPDGKVKELDFGLAKAWAGGATDGSSASAEVSQSPTLAFTGTVAGVILGTAAYMSPEQARGKPVDKRSDVWAFGVLLWEMLVGRRLFTGDTITDIIAALERRSPTWLRCPGRRPRGATAGGSMPPKDPRRRLPTWDRTAELQDVLSGVAGRDRASVADDSMVRAASGRTRERWAWAVLARLAERGLSAGPAPERSSKAAAAHFIVDTPGTELLRLSRSAALSPDGRNLVFSATAADGTRRLWIVRLIPSRFARSPAPRKPFHLLVSR